MMVLYGLFTRNGDKKNLHCSIAEGNQSGN